MADQFVAWMKRSEIRGFRQRKVAHGRSIAKGKARKRERLIPGLRALDPGYKLRAERRGDLETAGRVRHDAARADGARPTRCRDDPTERVEV
ncbi:MAG: hypothetical protein ACJ8FU_16960, partial [Xanthobacteraceae bacterium]